MTGAKWDLDKPVVRILTVADQARATPAITVINGGRQYLAVEALPSSGGPLALAVQISLPALKARAPHTVSVRVHDADRRPVAPNPLFHDQWSPPVAPDYDVDEETNINLAIALSGLRLERVGMIYFTVLLDGEELARLPFRIQLIPPEVAARARALLK